MKRKMLSLINHSSFFSVLSILLKGTYMDRILIEETDREKNLTIEIVQLRNVLWTKEAY